MATVCPLGLCRTEEDCPNAPCVDCMHRLGAHMLEEVRLVERQIRIAHLRRDDRAMGVLKAMLRTLSAAMTMQEMTSDAGNASKLVDPGQTQARSHTLT